MQPKDARRIREDWNENARWDGIRRPYSPEDVARLRGSVEIQHTLAEMGAHRLWYLLHTEEFVAALGAMTGNQAMQQVKAGLKAIYLSGWQVAADANLSGQMYPDQSLYPANSVPEVSEIWPKIGTATFGVADPCKCKEKKNESLFVMVSRKSPEVLGLKLESPG